MGIRTLNCGFMLAQLFTGEEFIALICCESLKSFLILVLLLPLLVVRGYSLSRQVNVRSDVPGGSVNVEAEAVRDLFTKKQALLLELRNYELNSQFSEISVEDMEQQLSVPNQHIGIIPVSYLVLSMHLHSSCTCFVLNFSYIER
jgi:hypothetical protein